MGIRRRALAAVVAAVAVSAGLPSHQAQAFSPPYIWHGRVIVTALTSACSTTPLKVGQEFNSNYRPRLQPASEAPAGLTLTAQQSAVVLKQNDANQQLSGNGAYVGWLVLQGVDLSAKISSTYSFTVKNFFNGSKGFDKNTVPLLIDPGKINNFGGTVGCTVTFRGAFTRMP